MANLLASKPQATLLKEVRCKTAHTSLWTLASSDPWVRLKLPSLLPNITLPASVIHNLWVLAADSGEASGHLLAEERAASQFLRIKIKSCERYLPKTGNYSVRVFPHSLSHQEFDFILQSVQNKIDSYAEYELLEPTDLCKTLLSCSVSQGRLALHFHMLLPQVSLQFRRTRRLSVVSTPLAQLLKSTEEFQTGYLTMDRKQRVLPLRTTDPLTFRYPLIGVWVAGVPKDSPVLSYPLVWSSCVRYVTSSQVSERLSAAPPNFLLVHFSSKSRFYEVGLQSPAVWTVATVAYELQEPTTLTCQFLQEPSLSDDRQSTRDSWSPPNTAEMVKAQARALQALQQQVHALRQQLGSPPPTKPQPLRLARGRASVGCARPEQTFEVPKIEYESLLSEADGVKEV